MIEFAIPAEMQKRIYGLIKKLQTKKGPASNTKYDQIVMAVPGWVLLKRNKGEVLGFRPDHGNQEPVLRKVTSYEVWTPSMRHRLLPWSLSPNSHVFNKKELDAFLAQHWIPDAEDLLESEGFHG